MSWNFKWTDLFSDTISVEDRKRGPVVIFWCPKQDKLPWSGRCSKLHPTKHLLVTRPSTWTCLQKEERRGKQVDCPIIRQTQTNSLFMFVKLIQVAVPIRQTGHCCWIIGTGSWKTCPFVFSLLHAPLKGWNKPVKISC